MPELNKPNVKKLGFISQELSREINTIGSKCNDATIQKYVIEMKDNLEKIRENILNIHLMKIKKFIVIAAAPYEVDQKLR